MRGHQIGYKLARFQRDKWLLLLEWTLAVDVLVMFDLHITSPELFLAIIGVIIPYAILIQWLVVERFYSTTHGYIAFLAKRLKKKSTEAKGPLPVESYNALMEAVERYGNKLTSGHANELTAALKALTPNRKVDDPMTFSEIRYAIKLRLISESYSKPHSERKRPFLEIAETLQESVSSLDKSENDCLETVFAIYDDLSNGIKLAASQINPESMSHRLRQWQLTTYRIGMISAIVLTFAAIIALL